MEIRLNIKINQIMSLDIALGIGGIPKGRIVEILWTWVFPGKQR